MTCYKSLITTSLIIKGNYTGKGLRLIVYNFGSLFLDILAIVELHKFVKVSK